MSKYFGPERTHGISSTYNVGCRCNLCRRASSDRIAAYRLAISGGYAYRCWLCDRKFRSAQGVSLHQTRTHRSVG